MITEHRLKPPDYAPRHVRLKGAYAKVEWARRHLATLESELSTWIEQGKSYEIVHRVEDKSDGEWHIFSVKFLAEPLISFGLAVGDIAHNCRSALDHLAWQLVERDGGVQGRWVQFPVHTDEIEWIKGVETPYLRGKKNAVNGVSKAIFDQVKNVQPFKGRTLHEAERTLLGSLSWLNNTDKHRTLHTTLALRSDSPPWVEFRPNIVVGHSLRSLVQAGRVLENGMDLLAMRVEKTLTLVGPQPEVGMNPHFGFNVAFGERMLLLKSLSDIAGAVHQVIEGFDFLFFTQVPGFTPTWPK